MVFADYFARMSADIAVLAAKGGYAALFLSTALEGIPVLGVAIPGHVIVILAGFLAATGNLNPFTAGAVAILGAIAGDFASFRLGLRYGEPLLEKLKRRPWISDKAVDKAGRLLDRHTGKALVIGRFSPLTRGIMPFLAGANNAPRRAFWLYNSIGAAVWVVASIALGYVLGLGYHVAAGFMGKAAVISILAAAAIAWGYRFVNERFQIFRKYELFMLAVNAVALYVLARMIQDAFSARSFMAGFDLTINAFFSSHLFAPALAAAEAVGIVFSPAAVAAGCVVLAIIMAVGRKWRSTAVLLASVGSAAVFTEWMKAFFMRARPLDAIVSLSDPSFPSSHAAFAAAFFTAAAYLLAPRFSSWVARELFLSVCAAAVIAIGLSRLVISVHWASDVMAGWALGAFCGSGSVLMIRYLAAILAGAAGRSPVEGKVAGL